MVTQESLMTQIDTKALREFDPCCEGCSCHRCGDPKKAKVRQAWAGMLDEIDALRTAVVVKDSDLVHYHRMRAERDALKAQVARLYKALEYIAIYGSDTLNDQMPDGRHWEREAVTAMMQHAETALRGESHVSTPVTMLAVEKELEIPESEIDAALRGEEVK